MDRYNIKINEKPYYVEIDKLEDSKFDYQSYEKSLEKILEQSQKEYWTHYIDINRHQIVVGRNNLWVSVALIGALSTLYTSHHANIDMTSIIGLIFILGYLSVIIAFGICLYAMPARQGYKTIYQNSWVDFSLSANDRLEKKGVNAYADFLSDLITKTESANIFNIRTNITRGGLFRITSRFLISSFILSLICISLFLIDEPKSSNCSILTNNLENYTRCICEQ